MPPANVGSGAARRSVIPSVFKRTVRAQAVQKAGITSQPKVQFYPVHNIYVPNLEVIRKDGSTALPKSKSA
jgi:hypothetical protein